MHHDIQLHQALFARLETPSRLAGRDTYLGASEIGTCLRQVIASKRHPEPLDLASMGRMLAGRAMENEVVQLVRIAMEGRLRNTGRNQMEVAHFRLPLRAHPDGRIIGDDGDEGDGILEVKTASTSAFQRYQRDGLPPHYLDQVQTQMGLTGLTWGLVVLVSRENLAEMSVITVTFDTDHFRRLEERAERAAPFLLDHACLPDGEPDRGFCFSCPWSRDCPQYQARRKAGERGEVSELTRLQLECQMEELTALEHNLEPMQERVSELREQIKTTLIGYQLNRVVLDGGICQMVTSSRTSFDRKTLQRESPDIYNRFLKTSTFTNLRITTKGATPCLSTAS